MAPVEVPDIGYPATFGTAIGRAAALYGETDFIVLPDRRMTYVQVELASRVLAKRMLAAGIGKGTRVGLFYTYGPEWIVSWLAASRVGALVMPFSTIYRPAELRAVLRIGDVQVLMAPPALLGKDVQLFLEETIPGLSGQTQAPLMVPELPFLRSLWITGPTNRPWATSVSLDPGHPLDVEVDDALLSQVEEEVKPADLAVVVYTSGSAALPKGVVHTHGSLVRTTALFGDTLSGGPEERRVVLCGFPFFWIGGFLILGGALRSGLTVCCVERFEAGAALDMVERERCGWVAAWPSLIQSMRTHPSFADRDLAHCPTLTEGPSDIALVGSPVPGISAHRGMSETAGNWYGVEPTAVDPASGRAVADMEEGELLVRGYGVTQGYYKKEREEVFDTDGWLHTGDRVLLHNHRPLFVGRFYEMIKSRGANVAPREVELVLESFPDVTHAVVFGLPHPEMEEEVTAVVVPAPGVGVDPVDLQRRARNELSSYKVPTRIEILTDETAISWLGSGKPDKLKIKAQFLVDHPASP